LKWSSIDSLFLDCFLEHLLRFLNNSNFLKHGETQLQLHPCNNSGMKSRA
jgi:hypothetical protein